MPSQRKKHHSIRLLISEAEAAEALGVCTKTLLKEVRAGAIPFVRIGRSRKYDPTDLKVFIQERKSRCRPAGPRRYRRTKGSMGVVDFENARGRKKRNRDDG